MRHLITIAIIYCCCSFNSLAQSNFSVKGSVTDTTSKAALNGATIYILSAKDSILQKYTYSNKGTFSVNNLKPGNYILQITYPDYADYSATFTLDSAHPTKDFGDLNLVLRSRLLNEVIIKARVIPIKIKGDTTEFNAAAYATQKNAKVEDLLKLLPGMRINQSGVIIFQGEQVQKILVDGEEFFGDDPALITKNVRADMVSKIQVYDDKTDQAKRSGMDDGQKVKTINVVLREDKKRGVFGKADAAMGTDKRYFGQVMANKFSPKEKIAIYGNTSNTDKVGLGGGDNSKYGGGFSSYAFNGVGLPVARDGGVHYDAKWNKDKQAINTTYKLGALDVDREGSSLSKTTLPTGFNTSIGNSTSHSHSFRQNLDARFNTKLDSLSTLEISASNSTSNASSLSDNNTTTIRGNGILLNNNTTHYSSDYNSRNTYLAADYHLSFKKPGRMFSTYGYVSLGDTKSDSYLLSDLKSYDANGILDNAHSSKTDQYKPSTYDSRSLSGNFSYTEPLAKQLALSFSMNFSNSRSRNNQQSFNKSASGAYDVRDPLFSNNYTTTTAELNYYTALRYNSEKITTGFNITLGTSDQKQTDNVVDTVLTRKFIIFRQSAEFLYRFSKAATINFWYTGQTQAPSFYQIQPLRQNTDLLNITIGNPLLKPSFYNASGLYYRVYQAINDQGINLRANYSFTNNAIVMNRMTDSAGVNTYQYSNLIGKSPYNWSTYLEVYGHPKGSSLLLLPNISISGNTSYNLINNKLSENQNITYGADLPIRLGAKNYSYSLDINVSLSKNKANLLRAANDTKGYEIRFNQYNKLPFNFFIGTDGQYDYTAPNQVFPTAFSRFLLKAYFGKAFLKEENLKITITGNDLLNQNTGYNRTGTSDNFSESRNMILKRFFMLTLTWDFSKFGTMAQPQKPE